MVASTGAQASLSLLASSAQPDPRSVDPLAEVARRACAGDSAAARRLLGELGHALLPVLRMLLGPRHPEIEDLLQESLIGVLRGLPSFRWESTVLHYARRVALRRGLEYRRRHRTVEHTLDAVRSSPGPAGGPSPHDEAVAECCRGHLRALLEDLSEVQAEALTMRVVLGYSIDEIAESTGVPANTVRSRLRLAKDALRQRIESDSRFSELAEVRP